MPYVISHRAGYRSKKRPETGDNNPVDKAPGKITRPVTTALSFITSCKSKGNRIVLPNMVATTNPLIPIAKAYCQLAKTFKFKKGWSDWRWVKTKTSQIPSPNSKLPNTAQLNSGLVPKSDNPISMQSKAKLHVTNPTTLKACCSTFATCGITSQANSNDKRVNGNNKMNR